MRETARDVVREAALSIGARRLRSTLTSAGIALGVAAFVGVTSLAAAAAASIGTRLERVAVTTVTLSLDVSTEPDPLTVVSRAERNLRTAEGVVTVGSSIDLEGIVYNVDAAPSSPAGPARVQVVAVTGDYGMAVEATSGASPRYSDFARRSRGGGSVVIVGGRASQRLNVTEGRGEMLFVAGRPMEVVAVADGRSIDGRLDDAVVVPAAAADRFGWLAVGVDEVTVVVRTSPGEAADLERTLRVLAWPEQPEQVDSSVSADPRRLRAGIESDTLVLVSGLSVMLLVVGIVSIGNVMFSSVMERLSEIGLRRALGASRPVIGILLLVESSIIGVLGGAGGAMLGAAVSVVGSYVQEWPVRMNLAQFGLAPIVGGLVGGVAGLYPALRAARIDPATTLRGA